MKTVKYHAIYDYGTGIERYDILNVENEFIIEKLKRGIENYKNLLDKKDFTEYSYSQLKMYIELTIKRMNKLQDILSRYDHI